MTFPAIHLYASRQSQRPVGLSQMVGGLGQAAGDSLFHHLEVNLLHVDLLVKLDRKFGALQQLRIDPSRHGCGLLKAGRT